MQKARISPPYAARMGLMAVVIPGLLLFFLCFGGGVFMIENLEVDLDIPEPLFMVLAFASGLILASLYWSLTVMPWRIWAFSRVSDPVELHAFAVAWYILHENTHSGFGKFFERLIISNSKQRQRWAELEKGIQDPGNFLLEERFIYFSPLKMLWWTILIAAFALMGLWFAFRSPEDLQEVGLGLAFFVAAMLFLFIPSKMNNHLPLQKRIKLLSKREVQLRISRSGLGITKDRRGFIGWKEIKYINPLKDDDKVIGLVLSLDDGQNLKIDASEWQISPSYLAQLLKKAHQHFAKH